VQLQDLIASVLDRDRRGVARCISLLERGDPRTLQILDLLVPHGGKARVVGVTGAPGTGKSTLVGALAEHYRAAGHRVGIIAVDPSSPFSGGALLGDRIRMARSSADPEVFIRSMASRDELGGLAPAAYGALQVLDAAGYDRILVETVGAGQAEVDIVQLAHTTLVVLVPGLGDDVQVLKAGIMEIADVYVINKAEREGTQRLQAAVGSLLDLAEHTGHRPGVVRTVASEGRGITELAQAVAEHWTHLDRPGRRQPRLLRQAELMLRKALQAEALRSVLDPLRRDGGLERLLDEIVQRRAHPLRVAQDLLEAHRAGARSSALPG
jgi:LAO/AO transport system kinase